MKGNIFDPPLATARGRIRRGTLCFQDHRSFIWPGAAPDPRLAFTFELTRVGVVAWADGFGGGVRGRPGRYGNGAIHLIEGPNEAGKKASKA